MTIRIGTRGSKLALWQAYFIADRLKAAGMPYEIVVIETKGDKILDRSFSKIGSKGLFTEELECQLLEGRIDIAVHSAKDVQSRLADDFELISFTKREAANDVLLSHKKLSLSDGITVGTSSTRRVAMLKAYHPQVKIVDMRGNLQTRIRKMEKGDCDALILAYAGVHRMGYDKMVQEHLNIKQFTPAVGQGTVAVEALKSLDPEKKTKVRAASNDPMTEICLRAERSFLQAVDGGCSIPIFGHCRMIEGGLLELNAGIISLDGQRVIRIGKSSEKPEHLGMEVAGQLMQKGGKEMLEEIREKL